VVAAVGKPAGLLGAGFDELVRVALGVVARADVAVGVGPEVLESVVGGELVGAGVVGLGVVVVPEGTGVVVVLASGTEPPLRSGRQAAAPSPRMVTVARALAVSLIRRVVMQSPMWTERAPLVGERWVPRFRPGMHENTMQMPMERRKSRIAKRRNAHAHHGPRWLLGRRRV